MYLSRAQVLKSFAKQLEPEQEVKSIPILDERTYLCHVTVTSVPPLDGASIIRALEKELGPIGEPQQKYEFYLRLTMAQVRALQDNNTAREIVKKIAIDSSIRIFRVSCSVLDR